MQRTTRSPRNGAPTRDRKIRIFLSCKFEDEERAKDLEVALRSAAERGGVFRSRKIEPGTEWRRAICENIAKSDILLLLYTDDSGRWACCLFECGMFLRSDKDVENRLICLHHPEAELPDPLKHLKRKAIGEKAERYYVHEAWMRTTACSGDVIENKDGMGRSTYDLRPEVCVQLSPQLSAILSLHETSLTWVNLRNSAVGDKR